MYTFLESARQAAADEPIKTPKSWNFFFDPTRASAIFPGPTQVAKSSQIRKPKPDSESS